MSQTLTFLGGDSGFGENNNSAFYVMGSKLILIDCGFAILNKVKNILSEFDEIDVIITHLHNDHAGTLSQLIMYVYFVLGKTVNVISKCERISDYLDITGTPKGSYNIYNSTEYVELIKTEHVKELDSYGMNLKLNNKNIVYTGDTNNLETFIPYIKSADELYVDVSKSSNVHLIISEVMDKLDDIHNNGTEVFLMHVDDKEYVKEYVKGKYKIM